MRCGVDGFAALIGRGDHLLEHLVSFGVILDRNRKLDAAAVRRILMATARDLGPAGHDDQFGSGLVDALGAVMQAAPASSDVSGSAAATAN